MHIGPKYKIARRVGAPIFEKTQTQKYALRAERKTKTARFGKQKSEFGIQLNEKQKARLIYGLSEKQFSNYVKEALNKKTVRPTQSIFEFLELRADNIVYRLGLTSTRRAARQMVSHGHIMINEKRVTVPSQRLSVGDSISVREGSMQKGFFTGSDSSKTVAPSWLSFDYQKKSAKVQGLPILVSTENMFDLNAVVEFYSR
jgi:small subunit ribosomal protein S4